jgi:hypothetical protein
MNGINFINNILKNILFLFSTKKFKRSKGDKKRRSGSFLGLNEIFQEKQMICKVGLVDQTRIEPATFSLPASALPSE